MSKKTPMEKHDQVRAAVRVIRQATIEGTKPPR
jgi:hypothetical protein